MGGYNDGSRPSSSGGSGTVGLLCYYRRYIWSWTNRIDEHSEHMNASISAHVCRESYIPPPPKPEPQSRSGLSAYLKTKRICNDNTSEGSLDLKEVLSSMKQKIFSSPSRPSDTPITKCKNNKIAPFYMSSLVESNQAEGKDGISDIENHAKSSPLRKIDRVLSTTVDESFDSDEFAARNVGIEVEGSVHRSKLNSLSPVTKIMPSHSGVTDKSTNRPKGFQVQTDSSKKRVRFVQQSKVGPAPSPQRGGDSCPSNNTSSSGGLYILRNDAYFKDLWKSVFHSPPSSPIRDASNRKDVANSLPSRIVRGRIDSSTPLEKEDYSISSRVDSAYFSTSSV